MSDGVPQFDTAEYSAPSKSPACKGCGQPTAEGYYRVNGMPACPACTRQLQDQLPKDSHAAFLRAVLFGAGGACLGLVLYVAFALATGLVIGFVSLGVGFLVGKAVTLGSRGIGGRRYQVAAVVLTYLAVSFASVPISIAQYARARHAQQGAAVDAHSATSAAGTGVLAAVGGLMVIGFASPFLDLSDPVHGLIGLLILFVGMRIAWRLTAGKTLDVIGPIREPAPGTVI